MKTRLLLTFFTLVSHCLTAQHAFRFDHLTSKDGLSQSLIYSIHQDHYGYLWIGTQDGLNRFDGSNFKVFKNNPFDSTTLTHNWVWTVQEDNEGNIWAGTFQGLCKYIRNEDRFVQYYHNMEDTTSMSGNRPNFILKDAKGRLWISSWSRGVNLYDEKTNTFRRFLHDDKNDNSLSDNYVRTMFCDSQGVVWIGTWNGGLNRVVEDEKGIRFQRFNSMKEYGLEGGNRITSITEDKQGNLWIASYESGLIRVDKTRGRFDRVPGFLSDDINKLLCDSKGNVWIGTNNGLHFFDATTQTFRRFRHDPQNPTSISSDIIYSLAEDKQGIVWISGNGLDKYDPRKNVFELYRHDPSNGSSLSQNTVWSFCEDEDGKVWIGLESGPVSVFDPEKKSFSHVTIRDDRGNIASNIRKIQLKDGVFWIGSFNVGLIRYEKQTGKTRFFVGSHPSPLGKLTNVTDVLVDDDNTVWICSNDNGLFHLDPETDEVKNYRHDPDDPASLGSDFLNDIHKDNNGNLWVGFWGNGMSMLDKRTGEFVHYRYDRKNKNGLSDQVVSNIIQQDDSIFWICTHTGLNKLNIKTKRFTHFFEKDRLANNVVYEMLRDERGNFWISSNGGISRLNPQTKQFINYTEEDGLQNNEFNSNASLESSTGVFYFGGVNGFNVFDPLKVEGDTTPLTVVLQEYKVYNKSFIPRQRVNLDHDQNYISFQFAALEFSSPAKVRYAYQLENFDKDWQDVGNKREAVYTNLDPGTYTFKVKAANADGYWSERLAIMTIRINPPFWKTWWFIATMIVLALGGAHSIHRYRLAQSLKVERLRNKIASDLHDEVGSSLTRISIYSDLLQSGTIENGGKNYLQGISNMSREIVGTMSDIVWSIDNRSDSFGSLLLRMKDFGSEVLSAKNIDMEFTTTGIDEGKVLDPVLKQNLYLIFKESVNNTVKHAHASFVKVCIGNKEGRFIMTIEDNGKGFSQNDVRHGNGLRNMERRAKAIGARFSLQTQQGTLLAIERRAI